jgi:hypothetical protein
MRYGTKIPVILQAEEGNERSAEVAKDDKAPDKVSHDTEFVIAPQPWLEKTTIEKGSNTYTGYGWTQEEADANAGRKYNEGESDKK